MVKKLKKKKKSVNQISSHSHPNRTHWFITSSLKSTLVSEYLHLLCLKWGGSLTEGQAGKSLCSETGKVEVTLSGYFLQNS